MSKKENIEAQKRMGEAVNSGELDVLNSLMAAGIKDNDPAPGQGQGPEGFIRFFEKFRSAFPDLEVNVEHIVTDDDNVAIAYTMKGTHKGEFMGLPATNRNVDARGMQIMRFENGLMVERWGSSDELGILRQIGALSAASKS
ncbi:MAG: ester cyclase [Pyrinomonadaceae bacterium]